MSLKVLIVEDEYLGMERLERQLKSLQKNIEIVGMADSVSTAVGWLSNNHMPDLILMDIDLGDGQSFEIFNLVPLKCHVIFTTSYDEHALHAFQNNDIDYLLKPIRKAELDFSIDKYLSAPDRPFPEVENLVSSLRRQALKGQRQRFLAKDGKKIISVELDQISYFFHDEQRNYLRTRDKKKLLIEHSLDEIESFVDPARFFRVNECFILGSRSIVKMNPGREGLLTVHVRPGIDKQVIVEVDKTSAFRNWMKR